MKKVEQQTKKVIIPKSAKGYGYVGTWKVPHQVGWMMPDHIIGKQDRSYPDTNSMAKDHAKGERFFLCQITVKPLKDKLGRPITKIIKK